MSQGLCLFDPDERIVLTNSRLREICALQPGDIVFIPKAGPQVAVVGSATNPAIYELKGDTLKVCNGGSDNERPKEFKEATGEDSLNSFVLKRVKDEKDAKSK